MSATPINRFLLQHDLRIVTNPCVSPDFCLDWLALCAKARAGGGDLVTYERSRFSTVAGQWWLFEDRTTGDCGWRLKPAGVDGAGGALREGVQLEDGDVIFPASFENLLILKNLIQEHDEASTIFPSAGGSLGRSTLGVGARFTTLHWPAVEWTMTALGIGVTANQNSIPRELVYDVDAMLAGELDTVPFPFIGTNVPEGHQGQSVEGMSHGSILSKLKHGFHHARVPWSFNADHQPIGGKFDTREDRLVEGCVLASYITFDLSPELSATVVPPDAGGWVAAHVPAAVVQRVRERLRELGLTVGDSPFNGLLAYVWPAMQKMKRRDEKYAAARARRFSTGAGRAYLRELSIDELPGLTTPETTAVMLALCEALEMKVHFVAPAFGFQKNVPYPDNTALRGLIEQQWAVCRAFDASIGFHSGSGKSAENYQIMGEVTGGRLEIKTSGRYTYEMGRALAASSDPDDQALWRDWYRFTVELAVRGAFSGDATEQKMARTFISDALAKSARPTDVFQDEATVRAAIEALPPSPEHMFWFEYNFLFVLAAEGRADKAALGDHSPAGYRQRARFYRISDEARLQYGRNVATYLLFLAQETKLVPPERCRAAQRLLAGYRTYSDLINDIGR